VERADGFRDWLIFSPFRISRFRDAHLSSFSNPNSNHENTKDETSKNVDRVILSGMIDIVGAKQRMKKMRPALT
jgi:hypothetical protein